VPDGDPTALALGNDFSASARAWGGQSIVCLASALLPDAVAAAEACGAGAVVLDVDDVVPDGDVVPESCAQASRSANADAVSANTVLFMVGSPFTPG